MRDYKRQHPLKRLTRFASLAMARGGEALWSSIAFVGSGIRHRPLLWASGAGAGLLLSLALMLLPIFTGSGAGAGPIQQTDLEEPYEAFDLEYTDESYTEEIFGETLPEWDWTAYFASLHEQQSAEETPALYKLGDTDPEINRIQRRLVALNYLDIDETTEYFGVATELAVQLFQRTNLLQVDGVVGQETWDLLMSEDALPYTIVQGNRGTDVIDMQGRLKELGFLSGKVTGVFGDETEKAVLAFQKRNGLTADGKVGAKTRDLLFSPRAKAAVVKTPTPKATSKDGKATPTPKTSSKISKMIEAAKGKQGKSYVFSAVGPNTFDCSGFVYYCLKQAGLSVSRYNAAGYAENSAWKKISSVSSLKKGDLIFWRSPDSSRVSHTGIYLGNGQFIHASSGKGKVIISSFSDYWRNNFVCGRRPFE